jgi:hypothetical protein
MSPRNRLDCNLFVSIQNGRTNTNLERRNMRMTHLLASRLG